MLSRALIMLVAMCIAGLAFAQAKPEAPTQQQLHDLFDQGNYAELLKQLRTVMALKNQSAYDQYDLLTLKAETLLRTKSDKEAADAFRDAAKVATDPKQASLSRANEMLLRRCRNEAYTVKPRGKVAADAKPDVIPVIESDSRKKAFAALLEDELTEKARQIDSVKTATSLDTIVAFAPTLGSCMDLERAAIDKTEKTGPIAGTMGENARSLIDAASKKMDDRMNQIAGAANKANYSERGTQIIKYKRGITTNEADEVQAMIDTSQKIILACDMLTKSLGKDAGNFDQTGRAAKTSIDHAKDILKKHAPHRGHS